MTITVKVIEEKDVEVRYLLAECGVRYWEDAKVNGVEDTEGDLIPCREGDMWKPLIELATGKIINWNVGTEASIHYKVCDAGVYKLLDGDNGVIKEIDGYVPKIMCPDDSGFGDYVIMKVDTDGIIQDWKIDLEAFEGDE
jgi:hypothetical protein